MDTQIFQVTRTGENRVCKDLLVQQPHLGDKPLKSPQAPHHCIIVLVAAGC